MDGDDCKGVTCQHGGTCKDGSFDFKCECIQGWAGEYCQCKKCFSRRFHLELLILAKTFQIWAAAIP